MAHGNLRKLARVMMRCLSTSNVQDIMHSMHSPVIQYVFYIQYMRYLIDYLFSNVFFNAFWDGVSMVFRGVPQLFGQGERS